MPSSSYTNPNSAHQQQQLYAPTSGVGGGGAQMVPQTFTYQQATGIYAPPQQGQQTTAFIYPTFHQQPPYLYNSQFVGPIFMPQVPALQIPHGLQIMPPGMTTHLPTANVVVTSAAGGQPIVPPRAHNPQQPKQQSHQQTAKKLLEIIDPKTRQQLDLSKEKGAVATGGLFSSELHKKVTELVVQKGSGSGGTRLANQMGSMTLQQRQKVPKILGVTVSSLDECLPTMITPTTTTDKKEEAKGTKRDNTAETVGISQNDLNDDEDPSGIDLRTPSQDECTEPLTEEQIRELEEQMLQMEKMRSEQGNNPDQFVYKRSFLYFIRKVTMVLKTVTFPKSEEELEELGLNRGGLPLVQSFPVGGKTKFRIGFERFDSTSSDQFKTTWQQTGVGVMNQFGTGGGGRFTTSRAPYAGRHSDNKLKPKKGPIARQSLDQRPKESSSQVAEALPRRSANAWKPKREERFDMSAPERNEEQVKYEKLGKEVRGLLNKITPSTYKELSDEFIQYKIHEDPKLLEMIVDLIFDKAVEEPHFCPLYSDLCKKQVEEEQRTMADKPLTDKSFRAVIIQKCQKTFTVSNNFDEKITELKKKIDDLEEGDEKGLAHVEEEIEQRKSKEKRRLLGIIRFISQLYRHQLLIDKIINWCVCELFKRHDLTKDEVYIEYGVELLETVGKLYAEQLQKTCRTVSQTSEQKDIRSLDTIFSHLASLKEGMSNRIRFAIMEVEDLRKNNWMPRGGEKGPKTIEEVREEMEKEQQKNEMERIEHDKQKEKMQQATRKGSRPSYRGRSSADRRSAAANVSSLPINRAESRITGGSKLRELDSFGSGLGGGRKTWGQQRDRIPQKEDSAGTTLTTGDAARGGNASSEMSWRPTSRGGTDSSKDSSGGQTGGN